LRNASDQFFEWARPAELALGEMPADHPVSIRPAIRTESAVKLDGHVESSKPSVKRRPRFVVEAVTLLAGDTSDGKVSLSPLGQYLKRTDPAFSPKVYGNSGLLDMLKTYDLLQTSEESGGSWVVSLARPPATSGST
jgi:hypothetical protein